MHIRRALAAGVVAALVVGALSVVAAGAGTSGGSPRKFLATLKIEKANVEVKKKGKRAFKAATEGQKLAEGDTVRTDATGLAEIDYTDDAYTRLDVNTTFTLTKLTEDQGARQIKGSLDSGQTWNRTEAVTESGSFEQSGAGATAAIVGTAFALQCDGAHCTLISAEHTVVWQSDENGEVRFVPQNGLCTSDGGALCSETRILTDDEMAAIPWIQTNLVKDLLLRGVGSGPFQISGVLVVENGQVVSFTPVSTPAAPPTTAATTPASTSNPSNPSNNPNPPPPPTPVIDPTNPILVDDGSGNFTTAALLACPSPMQSCVPASSITVAPGEHVLFAVHVVDGTGTTGLFVVFDALPSNGNTCFGPSESCNNVVTNTAYEITDVFSFRGSPSEGDTSSEIRFHIENAQGETVDTLASPIPVHVCSECQLSAVSSAAPADSSATETQSNTSPEPPPPSEPDPTPADQPTADAPPPAAPNANEAPSDDDAPKQETTTAGEEQSG
ncbi:MAG TPA: hypothetical protein VIH82_15045 [Acidimicrobiia bacterium]|jgi:hypothetical protein